MPEVGLAGAFQIAVAFPLVLFGLLMLLAKIEALLVQRDERAEEVARLLVSAHEPDEIEAVVARMLEAVVAPAPEPRSRQPPRPRRLGSLETP